MKPEDSWTQSFTGLQTFPLAPEKCIFRIEDIAHALALVNRYNGQTPLPYSVAQHSYYVSFETLIDDSYWGLMHDASEAYISDLISPVKRFLPEYVVIESKLMAVICDRFGMQREMPSSVKVADLTVLAAEARDLFPVKPADWKLPYPPVARKIKPWSWRRAELTFLYRFYELTQPHDPHVKYVKVAKRALGMVKDWFRFGV